MKFAKKIFVGIMALAVLVSAFAFAASADDAPERPVEDFASVLEYIGYDTYLVEDYEGQTGTDYEYAENPYFGLVEKDGVSMTVVSEENNKYLQITNNNVAESVGYKMLVSEGKYEYFVTSFDFKTDGANISVMATLGDYFGDITLFAANTANANDMQFLHSDYDYDRVVYSTVKADAVPQRGTWYHVDVAFSPAGEKYWVKVTEGDNVVVNFSDVIDESVTGIDSIRIYVTNPAEAGVTETCIDNLAAYEGTAVRDVINSDATLTDLAIKIDAYAKHPATPVKDKIEVAEFYKIFYSDSEGSFQIPEDSANKEELEAIKADSKSYINQTYLLALTTYSAEVASVEGYYAKLEYLEEQVKPFYEIFKDYADEDVTFDGLEAKDIEEAVADYNDAVKALGELKIYSEAFVRSVEEGYSAKNKDFDYMELKYASLSTLVGRVALDYKYSDVKSDTKYPTVADAVAEYDALGAKIAAITKNASEIFIPAVNAMDNTQAESISKESPYLTNNFGELYQNYLTASSVYANGTVHADLDPATYPGLANAIAEYLDYEAYIAARIVECNAFVDAIKSVESSSYYKTMVEQLANAALYLDENKEKSLEKFGGVEAAVAVYDSLVEKLANSEKAADAYIASVNAIDIDAAYPALKAAVSAANALKAAGSLVGYPGVAEADAALAKADAKLSVWDGHSSTLLLAVDSLKTATTLEARRELLLIALNAKAGAEDSVAGVSAAKAELETHVKQYNDDVARVNALFAGVVGNSMATISSVAPTNGVILSAEVVEALLK